MRDVGIEAQQEIVGAALDRVDRLSGVAGAQQHVHVGLRTCLIRPGAKAGFHDRRGPFRDRLGDGIGRDRVGTAKCRHNHDRAQMGWPRRLEKRPANLAEPLDDPGAKGSVRPPAANDLSFETFTGRGLRLQAGQHRRRRQALGKGMDGRLSHIAGCQVNAVRPIAGRRYAAHRDLTPARRHWIVARIDRAGRVTVRVIGDDMQNVLAGVFAPQRRLCIRYGAVDRGDMQAVLQTARQRPFEGNGLCPRHIGEGRIVDGGRGIGRQSRLLHRRVKPVLQLLRRQIDAELI